jgi:hypothetical protein
MENLAGIPGTNFIITSIIGSTTCQSMGNIDHSEGEHSIGFTRTSSTDVSFDPNNISSSNRSND